MEDNGGWKVPFQKGFHSSLLFSSLLFSSSVSFIKGFWDDMYLNGIFFFVFFFLFFFFFFSPFLSQLGFIGCWLGRWALPINNNPFFVFNKFPREGQVAVASALAVSTLKFALKIRNETLERSIVKGTPLCMSQYPKMFGTTRIPLPSRDTLVTNTKSRHIAVLVNGDVYFVDVVTRDGLIRSERSLASVFNEMIKKTRDENDDTRGLGIFTTGDRNDWAKVRAELESNSTFLHCPLLNTFVAHPTSPHIASNKEALEAIDSAIFVVCLDAGERLDGVDERRLAATMLHGIVDELTPLNRWFDKSVQLIVDAEGNCAGNFEHSWGDGIPMGRCMHEVYSDLTGANSGYSRLVAPVGEGNTLGSGFRKAQWVLTPSVRGAFARYSTAYKGATDNVDLAVIRTEGLGAGAFKKAGLSPDGTAQMAIQVAYHKLYNRIVSTYEACNMQHFLYGRTETIRSATPDSLQLVTRFAGAASNSEAFELLKRATKTHNHVSEDAKAGRGVDRHLYGLYCAAQQRQSKFGESVPELYKDPAYLKFSSNILSTSTVSAPFGSLLGFGAVNPGGYGIGYIVGEDQLTFSVASFRDHPGTDSAEFAKSLSDAFKRLALCFP